jgi:hypothetical protein
MCGHRGSEGRAQWVVEDDLTNSARLATYLNDHLAGATAGVELARRAAGSNRETGYGQTLSQLADELAEDRTTLATIMKRLAVRPDRAKTTLAWAAEKLGRLKLNGQLIGYSPLSRLEEIEALTIAVHGKILLWRTLAGLAAVDGRLADFDFSELAKRARAQQRRLDRQHAGSAGEALS